MYNPCQECKMRYGREYSEKCDRECLYAITTKALKDRTALLEQHIQDMKLQIEKSEMRLAVIREAVG